MKKAVIVIPARYASTRFPGKPLALILGKPMIQWVWEAARRSKRAAEALVATDDKRIADTVASFGGKAVMTKSTHRSGTDRMAEVARKYPADLYVNIQGDEPLMVPQVIDGLIDGMGDAPMATLCHPIEKEADWRSPEVCKVVIDKTATALYFSRSPLPFQRQYNPAVRVWRHVGIYAFTAPALRQFVRWKPGALEKAESLEQLRALENGMRIKVLPTKFRCAGVDTSADLTTVETILAARHKKRSQH
jgi:3-deoxy-manno-octulosonate cytidylyltransferase (CMP-KDO synthetase)